MSDLGGESPCWAHLADELDTRERHEAVTQLDLTQVIAGDSGSSGAIWSLPHGGDLDANLVRLDDGEEIGEHVNDEVDVFVIVWDGAGELVVDGDTLPLRPGVVVLVPRGARRRIGAADKGVAYLTVHRRRGGLTIGSR